MGSEDTFSLNLEKFKIMRGKLKSLTLPPPAPGACKERDALTRIQPVSFYISHRPERWLLPRSQGLLGIFQNGGCSTTAIFIKTQTALETRLRGLRSRNRWPGCSVGMFPARIIHLLYTRPISWVAATSCRGTYFSRWYSCSTRGDWYPWRTWM